MSSDVAIRIRNLSKCYHIYASPRDRLKQFLLPKVKRTINPLKQLVTTEVAPVSNYYKEFWALRDVSFEVRKGETLGILGRNGSGKSTLLQVIAGTLAPTMGQVHTDGVMAALLELGSGFNPDFTGRENVFLNGAILGLTQAEMEARFDRIASFADIGLHLDQPVKTYSSGMYVRLAFAVQACIEPDVLIVDEALSVGDERFQRKCFDYIERLRSNGCAILLVTHSTPTVEKFCQRAVLLHHGQLHGLGKAKEIVDQYHALLYSDEKAYFRYLRKQQEAATPESQVNEMPVVPEVYEGLALQTQADDKSGAMRAVITEWTVLDASNQPSETFHTGEMAKIRFWTEVMQPIQEIQAGILLRTVEGITAFGTSTLYHEKNYLKPEFPSLLQFEFVISLDLCPGSYFVTFAIAEAITSNDMCYLDRKTDVIVLNVRRTRTLSTGIAALDSAVNIIQVAR